MDTVSKELGEVHILAHGIANKKGIVVEHVEDTGYLLTIVKTCNNYPKAIDYLEKIGWYLDSINTQHELDGLNNWNFLIKEFLKNIKNG